MGESQTNLQTPAQKVTAPPYFRNILRVRILNLIKAIALLALILLLSTPNALAGLKDDRFDGNIYALYGGNGSLVPPRVPLAESLRRKAPALLIYFVDDSSDCKQYAAVVSRLQAYYGKVANFSPINVDAIPVKSKYTPSEPGYYYKGFVPQVVLLNQNGEVVLDKTGQVPFEQVDDVFREVFNLLPRAVSPDLQLRPFNEFNSELTK